MLIFSERKKQRENVHSFFFPSIVYSLVPFFFYVVRYRPISYDFGRCGVASRIDALFISPPRLFHIREECGESNFFYRRQGFGNFSCFKEVPTGKQHAYSRFRWKLLDELPPFDDYDITKGRTYKYFKGDVLYPFGYGLSYSSFKYSDLKVKDSTDKVTVSFRLKNTGRRKGDEVAQVYVRIPETGGIVPIKELKGFRRVPLEPGESRAIDIELDKEQLRYWDTTKEQFILPAGTFDVMVGASSKDIRLQTIIKL